MNDYRAVSPFSPATSPPRQPQPAPNTGGFPNPMAGLPPLRPVSAVSPVNQLGMGFLYLFIFLLVGRFCDIFLVGLRIPLVISTVALFFAVTTGQMRFVVSSRTAKAMLGLTLWMMLGTPFSLWRGGSVEVLSDWLKSSVSFIIILAMVDTVPKATRILQAVALGVLCTAGLTMIAGDSVAGRLILRQGLYSGPNELATASVIGLIAWGFVLGSNNLSVALRLLLVPFALFVASLMPKTGSRAALITVSVTLLFALFRFRPMTRILVLLAAVGGGFVMILALPSDIRMRYTSLFTEAEITNHQEWLQMQYAVGSQEERWRLFVDSLWVTGQYPVFGTGAGNFGVARYGKMAEEGKRGSYQGTHNTYTQMSSELGVPGFLFFISMFFFCWSDIRRVIRAYRPLHDRHSRLVFHTAHTLWLMLIAYMVVFCFEYIGYSPLYLALYALIAAFSNAAMKDHRAAQAAQGQPLGPQMPMPMPMPGQMLAPAHVRMQRI